MNHKETRKILSEGAEELRTLTESSQLKRARAKAQPFILNIIDDYEKAKNYAKRSGLFNDLFVTIDTSIKISQGCWNEAERIVGTQKVDKIKKARTHLSRCLYCQKSKEYLTLVKVLTNLQTRLQDEWLEKTGISRDAERISREWKQPGGQ